MGGEEPGVKGGSIISVSYCAGDFDIIRKLDLVDASARQRPNLSAVLYSSLENWV